MNDDTPPLGLVLGDRIILERKIEGISKKVDDHIQEKKDQAYAFYLTRMIPLASKVDKINARMWFVLGLLSMFSIGSTVLVLMLLVNR